MKLDKKDLVLYAVTDRYWLNGRTLYEVVKESLDGGVTFLQLREKKLDEDFVPLKGIIKSEDDEYLFVQYDILGIINDLTSNSSTYNSNIEMKNKLTINYMKNVDLSWPEINTKYINSFFTKFLTKGD